MQVCTSLQADNHASTPPLNFLQAGRPTNSGSKKNTGKQRQYGEFRTTLMTIGGSSLREGA